MFEIYQLISINAPKTDDGLAINQSVSGNYTVFGYNNGINVHNNQIVGVSGTYIDNCNTGIYCLSGGTVGPIICNNVPILAKGGSHTTIDKIYSLTTPTTVLSFVGTSGDTGTTLRGFRFPLPDIQMNPQVTYNVPLFTLPSQMNGHVSLVLGQVPNPNILRMSADVLYDGTTLTVNNSLIYVNGGIQNPTFQKNNNQLVCNFIGNVTSSTNLVNQVVEFDGDFYQQ